ncbi:MAG: hypothetical protein J0I10_20120 [Verrucomicrobia bacterium]|nr:hypothetical protein [Verrucomicrobiota bacterium]
MAGVAWNIPMKTYLDFDPRKGWPSRSGLFYECQICGDVIASAPAEYARCRCRNFSIDVDAGRMGARDEEKVRLFEEVG